MNCSGEANGEAGNPGTATTSLHDAGPTPERRQHGAIERLDRAIGDAAGQPSRPYRAVDTLAIMERRGSITAGMRQAGEDFRARFATAQLDPLRALDLSHLRLGQRNLRPESDGPGLRIEAARAAVWRAVQAVGGIASPAGIVSLARPRLGALGQGMGARSRAGAGAGLPRRPLRVFSSPRLAPSKRISESHENCLDRIFLLTNPDRCDISPAHWKNRVERMARQPRRRYGAGAPACEDVEARAARLGITAERVLREYARIGFSDMSRIVEWDEAGKMQAKPSTGLSEDDAPAIAEIVASASTNCVYRIKLHDKKPVLDALARHLGLLRRSRPGRMTKNRLDDDEDPREFLIREVDRLAAEEAKGLGDPAIER